MKANLSTKSIESISLSRSVIMAFVLACLISLALVFLGLLQSDWAPLFTRRYLDNTLCNLIFFVFIVLMLYAVFQIIGMRIDKHKKDKLSIIERGFSVLSGRCQSDKNMLNQHSEALNDNEILAMIQHRDRILTPLSFGIWVLPILGFIGTVIGITQAIGGLEPLLQITGDKGVISISESMSGVLGGLKYAFDTTLIGLVLVIPTMLMNIYLRLALSNVDIQD